MDDIRLILQYKFFRLAGTMLGAIIVLYMFILVPISPLISLSFLTKAHAASPSLSIHVSGNHFVNAQHQVVHLIGVNVPLGAGCVPIGRTPPGIFYFLSITQTAAAIVNWHANAVRIALNEDCWLGINGVNPTYAGTNYQSTIVNFVNLLHTYGIYVIVDLHENAPGSYTANSQQVMADADHALTYWQSVVATFKQDPAVLFEPYNEPHITTTNAHTTNPWECWRDGCTITETDQNGNQPIPGAPSWQSAGMQSIVKTIRATGATNPILLGGLNWSQDETQLLQYLPTDPQDQLAIEYHNYISATSRNNQTYWDSILAPIAQQKPIVTDELGEKDRGSTYITDYMSWADTHGISYLAWAWGTPSYFGNLGILSSLDGTPSTYGQTFYNHFRSINPTSNTVVSQSTLIPSSTDENQSLPTSSAPIGCFYQTQQPTGFFSSIRSFFWHVFCTIGFHSFCQQPKLVCPSQQLTPSQQSIPSVSPQQPNTLPTCQQAGGHCSAISIKGKLCASGGHVTTTAICRLNFHCCVPNKGI